MFVVNEAEAAAIRAAYDRGGELLAAAELVRIFPGLTNAMRARECARTIAGWVPLPERLPVTKRSGRRAS
jgi:ABC-type antimicrobial peptide transport system ATPase subunit